MDIMQLCRLCLVKDQVNIPIFGEQGDIRQIFLKITACLPVKVSKEDNLPKKICDGCLYKLELLYQFWNTTVNAEKQLLEWLNQAGLDANKKATDGAMAVVNDVQDAADLVLKEEAIDITEVRGDEEDDLSTEANSYILQQQQLPYQTFEYQQDGTKPSDDSIAAAAEETTQPPAKRQKVSAAPAQTIVNPETESDDDIDTTEMKLTKVEDDSDGENPEPTTFVGVDNEQPGPSGVGKTAEAPLLVFTTGPLSLLPKCTGCNNLFITSELLDIHKTNCQGLKLKTCQFCGKEFESSRHRSKHESRVHRGKPVKCPECDLVLLYKSNLKRHMIDRHSDIKRTFSCDKCSKKFKHKAHLKTHMKVHMPEESRVKCQECGKTFSLEASYKLHFDTCHRGVTFDCGVCNKSFKQKCSLRLHEKTHQPDYVPPVISCSSCDKTFSSPHGLRQHVEVIHKNNVFVCSLCGKSINSKVSFEDHMKIHKEIKSYMCEVCGKSFVRKITLRDHMVVHTKERRHKCDECGKSFTQRAPLSIHIRQVHKKETPHECRVCQRQFVLKAQLNTHMKLHVKKNK